MSIRIRLTKRGANQKPSFRIVVCDSRCSTKGKYIEKLGYYYPLKTENNFFINQERVNYWLKKGAQMSDTVYCLLKRYLRLNKEGGTEDGTKTIS